MHTSIKYNSDAFRWSLFFSFCLFSVLFIIYFKWFILLFRYLKSREPVKRWLYWFTILLSFKHCSTICFFYFLKWHERNKLLFMHRVLSTWYKLNRKHRFVYSNMLRCIYKRLCTINDNLYFIWNDAQVCNLLIHMCLGFCSAFYGRAIREWKETKSNLYNVHACTVHIIL